MDPLLEIKNLRTTFFTEDGPVPAVNDVSFFIRPGEILGLVGESGCGKSVTSLSILRLVSAPGRISGGQIFFQGKDLLSLSEKEMEAVRGNKISMIFQEPMTSLNPVMTIGNQIAEAVILHKGVSKREGRKRAIELLKAVRIPDPERRIDEYPHQMSGGMRQRVMIAMAIACTPVLLIADEPTTALDVTIQAQILELLNSLREQFQLSILLITHALAVVAEVADRVIVMYAGKIVEQAPVREIFEAPRHPYTVALLQSIPRIRGEKIPKLHAIEGTVPNLLNLPSGCTFYDRCKDRMDRCLEKFPDAIHLNSEHSVACYKY
ncbi:MAG: peptide ABC transporter ATP-binding protein [Acidobacteria bacterium]|nr:MAG: peptide ABC transporter ATP-binding protein [Acidobacteriota bacterium]